MDLNQILENMGSWVIGPGADFLVLIITLVLIKCRLGLIMCSPGYHAEEKDKNPHRIISEALYNFRRP